MLSKFLECLGGFQNNERNKIRYFEFEPPNPGLAISSRTVKASFGRARSGSIQLFGFRPQGAPWNAKLWISCKSLERTKQRSSERLCEYACVSAVCMGTVWAATLSFGGCLPLLARSDTSAALRSERTDVGDAGNSTCFSLQPPSDTNFDRCRRVPRKVVRLGARDQLDEDGCPMNPYLISDCIVDYIERTCEHSATLESRVFKFVLHTHTL